MLMLSAGSPVAEICLVDLFFNKIVLFLTFGIQKTQRIAGVFPEVDPEVSWNVPCSWHFVVLHRQIENHESLLLPLNIL